MPDHFTTCIQAEVMYPQRLSTRYLRQIYVGDHDAADDACGQITGLLHPQVEVIVDPSKFTDQRGLVRG